MNKEIFIKTTSELNGYINDGLTISKVLDINLEGSVGLITRMIDCIGALIFTYTIPCNPNNISDKLYEDFWDAVVHDGDKALTMGALYDRIQQEIRRENKDD